MDGPWQHCRDNDIEARGHVLIWPSWKYCPESLKKHEDDPPALRMKTLEHIEDVLTRLRTLELAEYDVMNEPRANHVLMDICGQGIVAEWFNKAARTDPNAIMYINEYDIISGGGLSTVSQDIYHRTVKHLLSEDAAVQGIGMQCHFGEALTPPARILTILDRFAAFGLPVQVTEFDVALADEKTQADYTRDFLTAVFSHPSTSGIILWGFWEGDQWKPLGALLRKDWSLKPNARAYMDLVLKEWWTDAALTTDAQGNAEARGFLGTYEITTTVGNQTITQEFDLDRPGTVIRLQLK